MLIDFPVGLLSGILLIYLWVLVIFLLVNSQGNKDNSMGWKAIFCRFSINEILNFCQFNLIFQMVSPFCQFNLIFQMVSPQGNPQITTREISK
jgi:hypothetical protein